MRCPPGARILNGIAFTLYANTTDTRTLILGTDPEANNGCSVTVAVNGNVILSTPVCWFQMEMHPDRVRLKQQIGYTVKEGDEVTATWNTPDEIQVTSGEIKLVVELDITGEMTVEL